MRQRSIAMLVCSVAEHKSELNPGTRQYFPQKIRVVDHTWAVSSVSENKYLMTPQPIYITTFIDRPRVPMTELFSFLSKKLPLVTADKEKNSEFLIAR